MEAAIGQTPGPIDHPCAARILAWGSIPGYSNWNSRAKLPICADSRSHSARRAHPGTRVA